MPCLGYPQKRREPVKTFSKVNMMIIPRGCMRAAYRDSWGDYWVDERGVLQIRAVEFPDLMFSHYVLMHEYLEAVRCFRDGISLESIEAWDESHADHDDPGCLPGAPYHKHHGDSMTVERILCLQDGYDWTEYYNAVPKEG